VGKQSIEVSERRAMLHTAYVCGVCGHRFRPAGDAPRDTRHLMCPACGSIDVNIVVLPRATTVVMRATSTVGADHRDDSIPGSG
jgi:DNA-directed RNA polymerase subunit RPC12/RpoP